MTRAEREAVYHMTLRTDAPLCVNCRHFWRHYIYHGGYQPIDTGHCTYPRIKPRKGYETCEHFEQREGFQP